MSSGLEKMKFKSAERMEWYHELMNVRKFRRKFYDDIKIMINRTVDEFLLNVIILANWLVKVWKKVLHENLYWIMVISNQMHDEIIRIIDMFCLNMNYVVPCQRTLVRNINNTKSHSTAWCFLDALKEARAFRLN